MTRVKRKSRYEEEEKRKMEDNEEIKGQERKIEKDVIGGGKKVI